jgi:cyclopropane fatty-acyl-phospholipid synthase-like methyltransferase
MSYKEQYTERLRENFLKYMREAFQLLPKLENPKILDLGCGSGLLSIELAKLTNADIYAIDINQQLLNRFNEKIIKFNLSDRIHVKKIDFLKNDFIDNYFDIIWEEGVVQIIGFKKSFKACHRILKDGGYLILGQAIKALKKNYDLISKSGFEVIHKLNWPEGCWWTEFYEPLEKLVNEIKEGKKTDVFENISIIEEEINWVKKNPNESDCAHYILKKE